MGRRSYNICEWLLCVMKELQCSQVVCDVCYVLQSNLFVMERFGSDSETHSVHTLLKISWNSQQLV